MKMIQAILANALILAMTAMGADLPFGYHSIGVDTYASGEPVVDGECYALVWAKDSVGFSGFNRDGTLVDAENNAIVFVCPLAANGMCPPVNFVIPESFTKSHVNGSYKVVVLDTRKAGGQLAGLDENGQLWRVNGWGWAKIKKDDASRRMLMMSASSFGGSLVDTVAKTPASCRRPQITSFAFDAEGNAVVEVNQTERYYSYRLATGGTPATVGESNGADVQDGNGTAAKIRLVLKKGEMKSGSAGFMRVDAVPEL